MIKHTVAGNFAECFAIIKEANVRNSKGGDYLDLTLGDGVTTVNAKLWSYQKEIHGEYAAGEIVKVRGAITEYNGMEQLKIELIRPIKDSDNVDITAFIESADYNPNDMFNALLGIAKNIKDGDLSLITATVLKDYEEKLLYWPGALKLHHAVRGGLLYHTLAVTRICEKIADVYPTVDRDLLIAGAILHDICKTEEIDAATTGIASSYTVEGNLLGHLTKGANIVYKTAEKLNIKGETVTLLMHMILSHHGEPEFGAAEKPQFLEAIILNMADNMDATVYEVVEETKKIAPGEFTGKIFYLERKLYNHGRKNPNYKPNLL